MSESIGGERHDMALGRAPLTEDRERLTSSVDSLPPMPGARSIGAAAAVVVGVGVLVFALAGPQRAVDGTVTSAPDLRSPGPPPAADVPAAHAHAGFIYGRVTRDDGATYEGRLRWGGDQEAFWDDYFDGFKPGSPWQAYAPGEPGPIEIFGFEIGGTRPDPGRPFMARFGDIQRVDAHFRRVDVTLKSGTVVSLDRFAAGDIDDGVRVWDATRGVVDLDTRVIRTIQFMPAPLLADAPGRLYGVVRTRQGEFTGSIEWNQRDSVSTDALDGRTADAEVSVRYDTMRSIAKQSPDSIRVTTRDGRATVLSGTSDAGRGHRGIHVQDQRYGRVLVPWESLERIDFSPGGSGPAYGSFPAGKPLAGSVLTRDGRRLSGRLVYDFDESETTDTFDVSDDDVSYNIPFGMLASIVPRVREGQGAQPARATLQSGEELSLQRSGDLGARQLGLLIFVEGRDRPEYVSWNDVTRIDVERPAAMYPPLGER